MKSAPRQFRAGAQVHDAAVGVEASADAGLPAIAQIDGAGEPIVGPKEPAKRTSRGRSRRPSRELPRSRALRGGCGSRGGCCATQAALRTAASRRQTRTGLSSQEVPVHVTSVNLLVADRAVLKARRSQIVEGGRHHSHRRMGRGRRDSADSHGTPGTQSAPPAGSTCADWPNRAARDRPRSPRTGPRHAQT